MSRLSRLLSDTAIEAIAIDATDAIENELGRKINGYEFTPEQAYAISDGIEELIRKYGTNRHALIL